VLASLNYPNIAIIHGVEERALIRELTKRMDLGPGAGWPGELALFRNGLRAMPTPNWLRSVH
jgi:hypothetical protein